MFRKKKKVTLLSRIKSIGKYAFGIAFLGLAFFFFWRFYISFSDTSHQKQEITSVNYLVDIGTEDPQHSCLYTETRQCFDNRTDTDFLYEEEPEIVLEEYTNEDYSEQENFNSPAAELFYQKLAELENKEAVSHNDKNYEDEDIAEKISEETLDKIYEEELPTDVIVEDVDNDVTPPEQLAEGYHVYTHHKDIKSLKIIPAYKPAYFGSKPVIAVVIDDMGISLKRTADIISLKSPITAAFLTYSKALDKQIESAKAAGLEIMVHAPMEPHSNADIAPDVLTTQMSIEEIKAELNIMLDKFHDIKGINNHMGSKLTEDFERMNAIMEVLKERDLFFLDSKTTAFSVAKKAAKQNNVPYATRHVFLDNENNVDYIMKQLAIAERISRRNGYAVAIGHPKTGTYKALKQWLPTLKEKGIKLIPLSKIVKVLRQSHI